MRFLQWLLIVVVAGVLAANGVNRKALGAEPENQGRFYEDDAWYDISEWFDGNDYNPTDERWGMWDDETYDYTDDLVSTDEDSDDYYYDEEYYDSPSGYAYGYLDTNRPEWFYDFYDDGYAWYQDSNDDGIYERKATYFDFNGDGLYDVLAISRDDDSDGYFDVVRTYSFNSKGRESSSEGRQSFQATRDGSTQRSQQSLSREYQIEGTVQRLKNVTVRETPRLVVSLETSDQRTAIVDLGPREELPDREIREGDRLTVTGPVVRIGNRRVVLAQTLELDGGERRRITRNTRSLSGSVASTRKVQVRGQQHTLAMLDRDGQQVAVDLGPTDDLQLQVAQGDEITVQGVPVHVRDRRMVIAQRATVNGTQVQIERGFESDGRQARRQSDGNSRFRPSQSRQGNQDQTR